MEQGGKVRKIFRPENHSLYNENIDQIYYENDPENGYHGEVLTNS